MGGHAALRPLGRRRDRVPELEPAPRLLALPARRAGSREGLPRAAARVADPLRRGVLRLPAGPEPGDPARAGAAAPARLRRELARGQARPAGAPRSLEEFFVARFGRRLYETFFKSYTEKVWGRPCAAIGAQWGAQRVKALSVLSALRPARAERFLYPRRGPGQLWEEAARRVEAAGGEIRLGVRVTRVEYDGARVTAVQAGERVPCDVFVSTMPVRDLLAGMTGPVPAPAREAAAALEYRDFLTVGLLVDELAGGPVPDNWIYVHSPEVRLGRIQVYNNWSEGMIADPSKIWLGLEYFCAEGDALWNRSDEELAALGAGELRTLGLLAADAPVRAAKVLRVPKAYPAYWGGYERFAAVREFVDGVPNLILIGRNGMHRYNNQDHSMLSAMAAVEHLVRGGSKAALWAVNAGDEHVEARA
ncbi:MAG: FAD-dependent oxidoreductase [Elusimicrobiota bacterium]|nr:MAG: FAD-dependent oxidoreductase [Elusimicrobiota bacterium]